MEYTLTYTHTYKTYTYKTQRHTHMHASVYVLLSTLEDLMQRGLWTAEIRHSIFGRLINQPEGKKRIGLKSEFLCRQV